MAKMTIKGFEEYELKLNTLGYEATSVGYEAVAEGAGIVANEIRNRLEQNINDPSSVAKTGGLIKSPHSSSGDLLDSLGIAPLDIDDYGNINTKVGFDGYDRKGTPNILKARAMESGTSVLKKRPFVRPAVRVSKDKAQKAMAKIIDDRIKKVMK